MRDRRNDIETRGKEQVNKTRRAEIFLASRRRVNVNGRSRTVTTTTRKKGNAHN